MVTRQKIDLFRMVKGRLTEDKHVRRGELGETEREFQEQGRQCIKVSR